jgi:exopolysaccharide biosynthesis polyprenyl glycosylphosphotransferase
MIQYKNGGPFKRRQEVYFPILLTLLDLVSVLAGLLFAYGLRFGLIPSVPSLAAILPLTVGHLSLDYLRLLPVATLCFLAAFSFVHLYRLHEKIWGWTVAGRLFRGVVLAAALFISFHFFARSYTVNPVARWMIPVSMITVSVAVALGRCLLRWYLMTKANRTGNGLARALVLGVGPVAQEVARSIREHPEFGWTVAGFLCDETNQDCESGDCGLRIDDCGLRIADPALGSASTASNLDTPISSRESQRLSSLSTQSTVLSSKSSIHNPQSAILGTVADLPRILEHESIEGVFVAQPGFRHDLLASVFIECQKRMVDIKVIPDLIEMLFSQVSSEVVDGIPLLGPRSSPLQGWNMILKKTFDLVVALFFLVFLSPVLAIIAFLVRWDSRGPILFRQERVGADGQRFIILKFRTMHRDAEVETGPVFSSPDDPRQTRVGRVLRQLHLDELPQLLNVLKGEMSLVGPRPERPHFVAQFREEIPRYMARHRVKSGMTGWAQVSGQSGSEGTISERLKYDLFYIEHWSLLFDLKVLFLTLVWLVRRLRQLLTLPPDHPSLRN